MFFYIYIYINVFPDTSLTFDVKGCMVMLQTCTIQTAYFAAIASSIFCSATNTSTEFSIQVQSKFIKIMYM